MDICLKNLVSGKFSSVTHQDGHRLPQSKERSKVLVYYLDWAPLPLIIRADSSHPHPALGMTIRGVALSVGSKKPTPRPRPPRLHRTGCIAFTFTVVNSLMNVEVRCGTMPPPPATDYMSQSARTMSRKLRSMNQTISRS